MTDRLSVADILDQCRANWPETVVPEAKVMLGLIRLNEIVIDSMKAVLAGFG